MRTVKPAKKKTKLVPKTAQSAAQDTKPQLTLRCSRCGRPAEEQDKFCAECGLFLRDAYLDHRLLLALVEEKDGHSREARQQLEHLLQADPNHVLANHMLGTFYFHQGTIDLAIERYQKAVAAAPTFVWHITIWALRGITVAICRKPSVPFVVAWSSTQTTMPRTIAWRFPCFTLANWKKPQIISNSPLPSRPST